MKHATIVFLLLAANAASAQFTPIAGFDRVATPSTAHATNSLAAEAAWLNAVAPLGTVHTIDMESLIPGTTGRVITIAPGVTMRAASSYHRDFLVVESGPSRFGPDDGFNTSAGGANHMRYDSGTGNLLQPRIQIDFDKPIAAFSLFITGEGHHNLLGDFGSTRIKINGSIHPAMFFGDAGNPYWPSRDQPNVRFGGFFDPAASITRVVVEPRFLSSDFNGRGSFSFDDIRWVPSPAPTPGAASLLAVSGVLASRRRRG